MNKKKGLAGASEETKKRVARSGGCAFHKKRGLQTASEETRIRVARLGGLIKGKKYSK